MSNHTGECQVTDWDIPGRLWITRFINECATVGQCTITYGPGGETKLYEELAKKVTKEKWIVKIDGKCLSACAIFADRARAFVCVTDNAEFGFHQDRVLLVYPDGRIKDTGLRTKHTYTPKLQRWIKRRGGEPPDELLMMPPEEAKKFWRHC